MKKIFLIVLIIIPIFLSSCLFDFKPVITGDRNVVTEIREIETFEHIEVSAGINVHITFGAEPSLKVEADKNLHDVIITESENRRLKIFADANIRGAKAKNVIVTVPEVRSINISSTGSVVSKNLLKTDEIEIEVSSAGKLELQLDVKKLTIEVSSSGKTNLTGKADEIDANVSSAGVINAFNLISQSCKINASSAGHASVSVEKKLEAIASSAGSISYKGDPKDKNIEKSSAGSVLQK